MKTNSMLALWRAIGLLLLGLGVQAAGPGPGGGGQGGSTNRFNDPNQFGWFTNLARWSNAPVPLDVTNRQTIVAALPGAGHTPPGPRPNGPITPADVQALVRQFQQDRQAFMEQQQALEAKMKGLPEEDRQKLRAQLKDKKEQGKQQQAQLREQLRVQCERMAEQLRDHSRLIDRVANPTGPPGAGGGSNPRGRP